MAIRPLKSLLPTADGVVSSDLPILGRVLLVHLKSLEGQGSPVYQQIGGINREYFFAMMARRNVGSMPGHEPEYGTRQPEVTRAMREAWNWLEREGYLMRTPGQTAPDWFSLTRSGEELLSLSAQMDEADKLLSEAPQARRESAWWGRARDLIERWNPAKSAEAKAAEEMFFANLQSFDKGASERHRGENQMVSLLTQLKSNLLRGEARPVSSFSEKSHNFTLIAESRLAELRGLTSPQFDFKKLIRLCEELNIASREDCHFATAMLTRGLLDHVPPVFGKTAFSEVANNYGGRSFKEAMQPLDGVARKVADWHLHGQIRKTETLPTAQQVSFSASLDMLLSEIVRVTQ